MYRNFMGKPICGICKKEFIPPQRAGRPSNYCSYPCMNEANKTTSLVRYHSTKHTTLKGTMRMFRILNRTLELHIPELQ